MPTLSWVRAHTIEAGALEGLEMLQCIHCDQVAQINRVTVIMHLQESEHQNCTAQAIDGFNRSAKENFRKKLIGSGKGRSCQKLKVALKNGLSLEPVLKKQQRKRTKVAEKSKGKEVTKKKD
jgi:hypothetical protein